MRNGFLGCVVMLAGFGAAAAQPAGPMPAMPFVMSPPPGMGYGPPPGMPYAPPPQPAMPFVMPPPPGMEAPGTPAPMLPPGMEAPMPAPPDGPPPGSDGADDAADGERPHWCDHFWADADFLLWWIKAAHTPTLLTRGSAGDAVPGALGQPGTSSLFGGDLAYDARPGGRFSVGAWLAEENGYRFGLQGDFFFLGQGSINFNASSSGTPVLAQPFLDPNTNAERATLIAFPGQQSGQFSASLSSRLWGAEVETRTEAVDTGVIHIDTLFGLRYLEFLESLDVGSASAFVNPDPLLGGVTIAQSDRFAASNFFYGAEIGADGRADFGPLSLRLMGKVAFGDTHEVVGVGGSTTLTTTLGGGSTTIPTGSLALPTNSGRHGREAFTVVPEGRFTVGYAVTKHVSATVGYSFLYASDVLRPGDQVDSEINRTQIPPPIGPGALVGPARPAFPFHETDFWAQGVNLGLEFRY